MLLVSSPPPILPTAALAALTFPTSNLSRTKCWRTLFYLISTLKPGQVNEGTWAVRPLLPCSMLFGRTALNKKGFTLCVVLEVSDVRRPKCSLISESHKDLGCSLFKN